LLGVLVALATTTAPLSAEEPVYSHRLQLPTIADAIGYPRSVTADPHTDEVFVCDTRRGRLLIYDGRGIFKTQITGGDVFSAPSDIAIDPEGYLVVVGNFERRRALIQLDFDGLFLGEIALTGLPEGSAEPFISSVALSPTGDRIYVVDTANLRLWLADRDGSVTASVDFAPGLSEEERRDVIIGHVDVFGETVLVAVPSSAEIRVFDLEGESRGKVGRRGGTFCGLGRPVAAALSDNGEVVIVDQQRMVIQRWVLSGNRCVDEHYALGNAPGYLYYPMDLALDAQGQLYVSQGFEGRVQMYKGMAPVAGPQVSP